MSKLKKLKKFLTLPEVAEHLTNVFEEKVTEADLLQFALEKHLTLSVDFVNHAKVRVARIASLDQLDFFSRQKHIKRGITEQCYASIRQVCDRTGC